ncbi:MAG: universal stress protein [Rhodobacteraceae bacterium]|nr:MAG: universal stress protein [Paracoccaceae bacterium]
MKHLLVASDLSARSDRALERAVQLARAHGARLTVAHTVDEDMPAAVAEAQQAAAREALGRALETLGATDAEVLVQTGSVVPAILALAERIEANLMVVGTHKPRPFWDVFSGTTVERFVRAVERPVLLVNDPVEGPWRSVLCGIDLSPACVAAGNLAADLAPEAEMATFHAVHVPYLGVLGPRDHAGEIAPFVKDAQNRIDAWWPQAGLSERLPKPEIRAQSVHVAFDQARRAAKAELFALGAHGRAALAPTKLGGFTETLIREPACDMLIVRGGRATS